MLLLALSAATALADPPVNDDMNSPAALEGDRGATYFDLTEATFEAGEPTPGGSDRITIWFSYTPSASGIANFSICQRDTFFSVAGASVGVFPESSPTTSGYDPSTGGCPAGAVNAAFNDFAVIAGQTYLVQVGAQAATEIVGGRLVYDFNTSVPPNDNFADAQEIAGVLPQTLDADNGLATREADEPGLDEWGPNNSLWYRWTPDADGTVSIDTCQTTAPLSGAAPDSRIGVFTSADDPVALAGLTLYATGDEGCAPPNGLLTRKYVAVFSGTEYWIRLANSSDEFGSPFRLRLRWVGSPETTGAPYVSPADAPAYVGQTFFAGSRDWSADPAVTEITVAWLRCDTGGISCQLIPGENGTTYVAQAADLGSRLAVRVTATNGVETTSLDSEPTAVIEAEPAEEPVGGGGSTDPLPPAPTDPFPAPVIPGSLGKLKLSRTNAITMSKLILTCGAAATGHCTGTLSLTTMKKRLNGKTIKPIRLTFRLSAAPGTKAKTTFRLGSSVAKAIKTAKSLKAKVRLSFGAPGWPQKTAAASATLAK